MTEIASEQVRSDHRRSWLRLDLVLAVLFVVALVASTIIARKAWMMPWWWSGQVLAGITSGAFGIAILARRWFDRRAWILVVAGLLIGQWHWVLRALASAIWRSRGFAP
jgi:hypothetical protein